MSSIFDPQVLKIENNWFFKQTSLFDNTNNVKYNISKHELDKYKDQFLSSKSSITNASKMHNESSTLEIIMRRCFKKCNKFVLEDWIEYNELDCTLKCSILQKNALKILQNKEYM